MSIFNSSSLNFNHYIVKAQSKWSAFKLNIQLAKNFAIMYDFIICHLSLEESVLGELEEEK